MNKLIALAMMTALFSVPAFADAGPDSVTLEAKNGNVTFDHKTHAAAMDCVVCHGDGEPGKVELDKKTGHAMCIDCHKEKAAGPTKCGECHKR